MRRIIISLFLFKVTEREQAKLMAEKFFPGLNFTKTYTPHFALCTDSLSEIMQVPDVGINGISSVMRFCCNGLLSGHEPQSLRKAMNAFRSEAPETVDLWREIQPEYYLKAVAKAAQALRKSFKEFSILSGNNFNVLVLNNDILPMIELAVPEKFESLEIAQPGNLIQIRYEVTFGLPGMLNWRVLHAYHYK